MRDKIVYFCILFSVFRAQAQSGEAVILYLTPSVSEQVLKTNGEYIKNYLEKEAGVTLQLRIPKSYDQLIDDFGQQKSCIAFMSSQSYVVANTRHNAVVKLRIVRANHSVYQGMIVTQISSGIKTLKDLDGKTIAYTDELSTSGYLYPKKILEKENIKPAKEIFLKKHDEVVKQVYEKKVDAGAAFFSPPGPNGEIRDARGRVMSQYPDVEKKVIVLAKTDPIPNDPVVFSKNFDAVQANKICMALMKLSKEEKGKQVLMDLYGTEGFVRASDADYNSLRQVMGSVK